MKNDLDFSVYVVNGDEFEGLVELASVLRSNISECSTEIEELQKEVESIGNKLNLYVNNMINFKFSYKDHILLFDKDKTANLYSYKKLYDSIKEEDIEDKLNEPLYSQKVKQSQIKRCIDYINDFNEAFLDYDCVVNEMNEYIEEYDDLISNVKEDIKELNISHFNKKDTSKIVAFDEEKHDLLIVKDSTDNSWKFVYLDKANKETFMNHINNK